MKDSYNEAKNCIREQAIEYSNISSEKNLSYGDIAIANAYFSKMAKRYGLQKEFKENGII